VADVNMFKFHRLNTEGAVKATRIQHLFEATVGALEEIIGTDNREMSLVRTKLEEACFFAKKAMAVQKLNQAADGENSTAAVVEKSGAV
jgi:hypothetical protein